MPPFLLIIFLVITATLVDQFFLTIPQEFLRLSLPNWAMLAFLVLVLSWCFGE